MKDGRYVVITFETAFENKMSAIETVTPRGFQGDSQGDSGDSIFN